MGSNFARLLIRLGLDYQYEPVRFTTPLGSYTPDFYLPKYDMFVEIKGWEIYDDKQKIKRDYLIERGLNLKIILGNKYNKIMEI